VQVQAEFLGEIHLSAQTENRINQIVRVGTFKINNATGSMHSELVVEMPIPHADQSIQGYRPLLAPLEKLIEAGRINNPQLLLERAVQRPDISVLLQLDPVGLGIEPEFLFAEFDAEHGNSLQVVQQIIKAGVYFHFPAADGDVPTHRGAPPDDVKAKAPRVTLRGGFLKLSGRLGCTGLAVEAWCLLSEEACAERHRASQHCGAGVFSTYEFHSF
jgi:hypothetical protein